MYWERGGCSKQGSVMGDIHTCPRAGHDYTEITANQLVECTDSEFNSNHRQLSPRRPKVVCAITDVWCVAGDVAGLDVTPGMLGLGAIMSIMSRCGPHAEIVAGQGLKQGHVRWALYCWCYEGYIMLILQLSGWGSNPQQHFLLCNICWKYEECVF